MGFWETIVLDGLISGMDALVDGLEKIGDFLGLNDRSYDLNNINDNIDIDACIAEYIQEHEGEIKSEEKKCMKGFSNFFDQLKRLTSDRFPDLVEIVEEEQKVAEKDLKGSVKKYIKEHLSKNDPEFRLVLEMEPGYEKDEALEGITKKIFKNANKEFKKKLKKHMQSILEDFSGRIESRMNEQEKQIGSLIDELEILKADSEKGQLNISRLKGEYAPNMESSACVIQIFDEVLDW